MLSILILRQYSKCFLIFGSQQFQMDNSRSLQIIQNECLEKLEKLLKKVKMTVQSKADLHFMHKYRCDYQITQPKYLIGGQLKPYQLEALQWMINLASQNSNAILADDMGLGKTIQAISFLAYQKEEHGILGKHLIICPKSVVRNWQREIKKWFPTANVVSMMTNINTREEFLKKVLRPRKFDILITNYQGAKINHFPLSRIKWEALIIDEAHKLKNNQTQTFIILNTFQSAFRLLLTGTPLSNNLKELWCLMNFIMPELFEEDNLFNQIEESTQLFEGTEEEKLQYQCKIAKHFHEIISPFFKRRTKKQLELGLPTKSDMTLFVPLSKLQLRLYKNFLRYGNVLGDYPPYNGHIMQPRKICLHPHLFNNVAPDGPLTEENFINSSGKLKVLDKLLNKLINEKHKVLIFSQFTMMLDLLETYCDFRSYKYCRIDGSVDLDTREKQIKDFNELEDVNIFLLSTKAGGLGLNLVAADRVVIYDIDWNPQNDLQATDRAYRIGQKNDVIVYKMITQHTIQERMLQIQKYKLIWDQLVIQRGAFLGKKEDPFDNINMQTLSMIGRGQIFHLQPHENEQNIEEILALGALKDKEKQEIIRQKLKKTIEQGHKINPFENMENEKQQIFDVNGSQDQFVQRRNYQNNKRQKSKFERDMELPAFKFYQYPQLIKEIQFQIHMENKREENRNEKVLQLLYEKLKHAQQKGKFHNWNQYEFDMFVQSHKICRKNDYKKIADNIGSKNEDQVKQYSIHFFQKAPNNHKLNKSLYTIHRYQGQLKKQNSSIQNVKDVEKITSQSCTFNESNSDSAQTQVKNGNKFQDKQKQKERIKLEKQMANAAKKAKRQEQLKQRQEAKQLREEEAVRKKIEKEEAKKVKAQKDEEAKKLKAQKQEQAKRIKAQKLEEARKKKQEKDEAAKKKKQQQTQKREKSKVEEIEKKRKQKIMKKQQDQYQLIKRQSEKILHKLSQKSKQSRNSKGSQINSKETPETKNTQGEQKIEKLQIVSILNES